MPEMDGFQLLDALRRGPGTREMPILLLSARAGEEARIEGFAAGADDYLVKPFSARELVARVGTHLEIARVRREATRGLRESEERFRNMADNAPVMIWVTDPSGCCTYLNRRWYEFTGQSAENGLGYGWLDAVHPDDREASGEIFLSSNARKAPFRLEYRLRRADGEYRWAIDAAAPRFGPDGEYHGYIGSVIDISERKQVEEEREKLLAVAEAARAEAEEANQAKATFLATMSHELRTPLNAIIGYTDLLTIGVTGPITEAQARQLGRITAGAKHLLQLIEEVLTFSRIEAGRLEVRLDSVDPTELIRDTVSLIAPLAQEKGLAFDFELPEPAPAIITDEAKVRQVLINLLGNAIKFTEKGEVSLRSAVEGDEIVFEVRDTGIGIRAEDLENIFEPFRQASRGTTRHAEGTGLGLSVSRQLARLLGGDVSVHSRAGKGSAFALRLPLRSSPPPATSRAARGGRGSGSSR